MKGVAAFDRPGLVFQNNVGNQHSPNLIVLPLTSALKKTTQPTHVFIPKEVGLRKDSMVLCENPECMSKYKLGEYITTLPEEYMAQVAVGNILSSSAISFIDTDLLSNLKKDGEQIYARDLQKSFNRW